MLDEKRLRTFLLGGAVGLLTGILLAPRSGRELRGSLANRAGEAHERGRETYFDAQEQMRERLAELREGAHLSPEPTSEAEDAASSTPKDAPARAPGSHLRDVSYGSDARVADEAAGREAERSEELRRKVRETRERLRGRKDRDLGPER